MSDPSVPNLAVFADYENVAIGARDAGLEPFDIGLVMARLLERGKVLLKRAYCDWSRYTSAKRPLHEAGFQLVEVPHLRYSGKNSADILMAVEAIDLCHTKPHIDVFALITGDSDFSPLVSKLRENGKEVVGIGVKASSSSLLVEGCDDFTYYDDLVRVTRKESGAGDRSEALALFADTAAGLLRDRGSPVHGSHVKQVLKRKLPQFSEAWYGFGGLNELIEAARDDRLLRIEKDERSGGYVVTGAS